MSFILKPLVTGKLRSCFPICDPGTLEADLKAATKSLGHSQERKSAYSELSFQDNTACSFIPKAFIQHIKRCTKNLPQY